MTLSTEELEDLIKESSFFKEFEAGDYLLEQKGDGDEESYSLNLTVTQQYVRVDKIPQFLGYSLWMKPLANERLLIQWEQ